MPAGGGRARNAAPPGFGSWSVGLEPRGCCSSRGADVGASISRSGTALHLALGFGRADIVQLLLEYRVDADRAQNGGETALVLDATLKSSSCCAQA